jgi:hypothetical protein
MGHDVSHCSRQAALDIPDRAFLPRRVMRFADVVPRSGLVRQLKAPGPMTLVARVDEALAPRHTSAVSDRCLGRSRLRAFGRRHFASGASSVLDPRHADHVDAVDEANLPVHVSWHARVGAGKGVDSDVCCSNGITPVVDAALAGDLLQIADARRLTPALTRPNWRRPVQRRVRAWSALLSGTRATPARRGDVSGGTRRSV